MHKVEVGTLNQPINNTNNIKSFYISETNADPSLKFCTLFIENSDIISRKYETNVSWSVRNILLKLVIWCEFTHQNSVLLPELSTTIKHESRLS